LAKAKLEIADIFQKYGPAWRQANKGHVSLSQLKVMSSIEACRTEALRRACGSVHQMQPSAYRVQFLQEQALP
jgi:hypothetical protein